MVNLLPIRDNEALKMAIQDPEKDLDIINYLFPHSVIEIDVVGNDLIAIVKTDSAV